MPRTGPRVVCALWVTIETLAPTSALVSVDLPLFGAPISATKPQRVTFVAAGGLDIRRRLPHSLAQQHSKCGSLLGGALVGATPALRLYPVYLPLRGKARGVVGALASNFEIAGQRQAPALSPFLQQRLRVRCGKLECVELRFPEAVYHRACRVIAAVGKNCAEHSLASVGEDGL